MSGSASKKSAGKHGYVAVKSPGGSRHGVYKLYQEKKTGRLYYRQKGESGKVEKVYKGHLKAHASPSALKKKDCKTVYDPATGRARNKVKMPVKRKDGSVGYRCMFPRKKRSEGGSPIRRSPKSAQKKWIAEVKAWQASHPGSTYGQAMAGASRRRKGLGSPKAASPKKAGKGKKGKSK